MTKGKQTIPGYLAIWLPELNKNTLAIKLFNKTIAGYQATWLPKYLYHSLHNEEMQTNYTWLPGYLATRYFIKVLELSSNSNKP